MARPTRALLINAQRLLRRRSVVMMVSTAGDWPDALELAEVAHQRDCTVVALTNSLENPLAKIADHAFQVRVEGEPDSPAMTVCLHAALNFAAFEAARILQRPEPQWGLLEEEFIQLPDKLEWVFTQLSSVVRSVAAEMPRLPRLRIVGGGFNHFPAWQAAWRMRSLASPQVGYVEASEFLSAHTHFARRDDAILFLSGSHSKMKKLLHRCAAQARENGARVLSLTDSNDRDLAEGSDLGILVPLLLEAPAATLTLFMLEWLAMETQRAQSPTP